MRGWRGASPAGPRLVIDPLAELKSKQPANIGAIDERAGDIDMIGITPAVDFDRPGKMLQSFGVLACAANDSAARRFYVTERDVVVGCLEYGFGAIEDLQSIARQAPLKQQP